jgi:WD repeat-containing protein 23
MGPVLIDFGTTDDDDDDEDEDTAAGAESTSNENEEESSQAETTRPQPARQTIARQWQLEAFTKYIPADGL